MKQEIENNYHKTKSDQLKNIIENEIRHQDRPELPAFGTRGIIGMLIVKISLSGKTLRKNFNNSPDKDQSLSNQLCFINL
ncbi:hypothetical protein ACFCT7_00530 [Fulvivirgaceae bacterium LMO-SS25]